MKSYLIIFICLCLLSSCKKKENDPQPIKADEVMYQTSFEDNVWSTRVTNESISEYNGETFRIAIDAIDWMAYELAPYANQLDYTYSIEAEIKLSLNDDSQLGHGGFIYNFKDNDNFSVLLISNNGTFHAYKKTLGVFSSLFYITVSKDLIKGSGQTNTIAIRQYGYSQEIVINGVSQGIFPFTKAYGYIQVGLLASSNVNHYTPVSVTFDNFTIKKIY